MSEKDRSKHTFWAKEIIHLAEKREHDRVETEIAAIPEIVPKQENLRKNGKYKDYIPARERCCMFEYADAEKAEKEADFRFN